MRRVVCHDYCPSNVLIGWKLSEYMSWMSLCGVPTTIGTTKQSESPSGRSTLSPLRTPRKIVYPILSDLRVLCVKLFHLQGSRKERSLTFNFTPSIIRFAFLDSSIRQSGRLLTARFEVRVLIEELLTPQVPVLVRGFRIKKMTLMNILNKWNRSDLLNSK